MVEFFGLFDLVDDPMDPMLILDCKGPPWKLFNGPPPISLEKGKMPFDAKFYKGIDVPVVKFVPQVQYIPLK